MKYTHYEIYFATGSPVAKRTTLFEAKEYAKELSRQNHNTTVVIERVVSTPIKMFENGEEKEWNEKN